MCEHEIGLLWDKIVLLVVGKLHVQCSIYKKCNNGAKNVILCIFDENAVIFFENEGIFGFC